MRFALLSLAGAAVLVPAVSAQSFDIVGPGFATGVSDDGSTVVGTDFTGFTWTAGGGQVSIGGNSAWGITPDGSAVAGLINNGGGQETAGIWTNDGWNIFDGLPGSTGCPGLATVTAISDDGSTIVGFAWDDCTALGAKWTVQNGVELLPDLGPKNSRANAISGDGQVIGGWDENDFGTRRAALWSNGTKDLILVDPVLNPEGAGEVYGLNNDGTVAVGFNFDLGAWRWRAGEGVTYLDNPGFFLPPFDPVAALACNDDGTVIVGSAGGFFGAAACIWTEEGGAQILQDLAVQQGVPLPANFNLFEAVDITPDGLTIVGAGGDFFPNQAFTLTLVGTSDPWVAVGGALPGTPGEPVLEGQGSLVPGTQVTAAISAGLPGAQAFVVAAGEIGEMPFKGGVLVPAALPSTIIVPVVLDGTGAASLDSRWPGIATSGTQLVLQAWIADPAGPQGYAATGGVVGTTP